jgi:hypothetical protein
MVATLCDGVDTLGGYTCQKFPRVHIHLTINRLGIVGDILVNHLLVELMLVHLLMDYLSAGYLLVDHL